jgi:hypothetical protein
MATPLDPQKRPDIFLIRGDSSNIDFSVPGIDLTGATVFFTAKPALVDDSTDATAVIEVEVTEHTDPTNGVTVIPLTPADTDVTPGIYYYDIQVVNDANTIVSIPVRKLQVFQDVTRRTY